MADFPLSVAICTHNPRRPTLERTVEAIRRQTYPAQDYEFLIIDNCSEPPIQSWLNLDWHPNVRWVREDELGISVTRQRAIKEARADLILYVDDDNVIEPDFIEKSMEIARDYPFIGAFGPATIKPEFAKAPPPDLLPFTGLLMHYELPDDVWANFRHGNRSVPPTAGMTVRRPVAEQWIRNNEQSALRRTLGRRGDKLFTGGDDVDLSLTACDLGMGTGIFVRLRMTHVYHPGRVDPDYLMGLWEGNMFSEWILNHVRGLEHVTPRQQFLRNVKDYAKLGVLSRTERQFHLCRVRGQRKARAFLRQFYASGGKDDTVRAT